MSSRLREMAAGLGIPGAAEVQVCGATAGNEAYDYWHFLSNAHKDIFHTSIITAEAALTGNRNDVLLLTPENHTLAALLTWDLNMTHLVGMYPPHVLNMRARLGHSVTLDPMVLVTGYGCLFKNIYTMYGAAVNTDLTGWEIQGNRNSFERWHLILQASEPADVATFKLLYLNEGDIGEGLEHYFNHCTLSSESILMTDGEMIKMNGTPRLTFEDCSLIMRSDAADPMFIDGTAGDGEGFIIFKNCVIHNLGTSLTYGIGSTGIAAGTDYILVGDTSFGGCDDVIAGADEAKVWAPARVGATEDAYHGLSMVIDQAG